MLPRHRRLVLLFALASTWPAIAAGQTREEVFHYRSPSDRAAFDVQLFEPSTSPRSISTLDLPTVPNHLSLSMGLWSSYAARPWVVDVVEQGTRVQTHAIVGHLFQSELHAALGLFNYFEVGVALPLIHVGHAPVLGGNGQPDLALGSEANDLRLGDLRGFVKVPLLRGAWPLALRLGVTFPTGGRDAFAGNLNWTFTPSLVASHDFGPVSVAANVGVRWRERNGLAGLEPFVLDDEVVWGVGARYQLTRRLGLHAELLGRIGIAEGGPTANRTPLEVLAGGTIQLTDTLALQLGAGRGLSAGYGSPEFRGFLGLRFTTPGATCTTGPEDYDGFQDGDYCADPDNDGDGIPDERDRCPNDPEDFDGFQDEDGCPDPDNDADGIPDADDRCPVEPEDHDGYADEDGCPDVDNDRDGVPDSQDDCPMEPEDLDGYQDEDGCPEPGPEAVVVTRTESHLLLSQRVFFDYDSDTIRNVSLPILNEVALTLRRNPDITRVRIEGYTDGQGVVQYNLDLSYRRARAVVEYLVSQGVPREHLEYQGYGPSRPVADDSTPEGQALNRRVEFSIVRQGGAGAASATHGSSSGTAAPASGRRRRR